MQFIKKYWWAILLVAVIVYLLWKSMKSTKDDSGKTGTYINVGGQMLPATPITDAQGNVPTPVEIDLTNLHKG